METRDRIVYAAERTIDRYGLAGATTKRIAAEAGCSEALLYKHFPGKEALLLAVVLEREPTLGPPLMRLKQGVGTGDLTEGLIEFAAAAVEFYARVAGIASGMLADPSLAARFRSHLAGTRSGPHTPIVVLATILEAEQSAGRIDAALDPQAAATLLLGACFHRANLSYFVDLPDDDRTWAAGIVGTLFRR